MSGSHLLRIILIIAHLFIFLILASLIPLGMDISPIDLINIQSFASRVIGLVKYRQELSQYLSTKMTLVAPNLTTLIGEQVSIMILTT